MTTPRTKVFIVDDHPLVREWLANLLRLEPDLEVVGEAEEAAAALDQMIAAPPDIAVVDLSLKRGSGLMLIKDLVAHLPATRVVVLSMHEEIGDVERALRAGALGYVMKRESTGQIVAAIRQVQEGKLFADPAVLAQLTQRMVGRTAGTGENAVDLLSDRELDVFRRLGEGHPTRRIAEELNVSQKTVQAYCARIKIKLGLADSSQLARAAVRWSEQQRA
ncbi:MAG TPA: response regulator transcription factor [Opitutaceae bacterium]|nr:response regulator transcription factor [Opitutaceae bacterium]HND62760.1 response regulator transcription factor [Opitutaceae bacterium]